MWRGSPPLQAQIAQFEGGQEDRVIAFGKLLLDAALKHPAYHATRMPHKIGDLPEVLSLDHEAMQLNRVLPLDDSEVSSAAMLTLPLGQKYDDLQPYTVNLNERTGHIFVAVKQASELAAATKAEDQQHGEEPAPPTPRETARSWPVHAAPPTAIDTAATCWTLNLALISE